MSRHLSLKQKEIIVSFTKHPALLSMLEDHNDYETLSQDTDRFINDYTLYMQHEYPIQRAMSPLQADLARKEFIKKWK